MYLKDKFSAFEPRLGVKNTFSLLLVVGVTEDERNENDSKNDEDGSFSPTWTSCYVFGRSYGKLLNQGPAVGMMCESCAKGFAVP
jgi:hypothetical protein